MFNFYKVTIEIKIYSVHYQFGILFHAGNNIITTSQAKLVILSWLLHGKCKLWKSILHAHTQKI